MALWVSEACPQRKLMPQHIQDALNSTRRQAPTNDPEYQKATMWVYEQHVCRVVPFPPEVTANFDQMARNPTVYNAMNGPNEFFVVGS